MSDDASTFRRVPLEVFNDGKLDLIDEIFAEDYVEHVELPPGFPEGRDAVRAFVSSVREAFPDFRFEILQQHHDGDHHIGYIRASGTMSGEFMGMPPSNKSASWDEIHIARFANGRVTDHWAVIDQVSMLRQLGFMPE